MCVCVCVLGGGDGGIKCHMYSGISASSSNLKMGQETKVACINKAHQSLLQTKSALIV